MFMYAHLHTYVDIMLECAALEEDTDTTGFCPLTSNWDISPEIEDESLLDGEVGKRLNHLAPIPVSLFLFSVSFLPPEIY